MLGRGASRLVEEVIGVAIEKYIKRMVGRRGSLPKVALCVHYHYSQEPSDPWTEDNERRSIRLPPVEKVAPSIPLRCSILAKIIKRRAVRASIVEQA